MAFVKFEENRFRIDREIAENHEILVDLTASIVGLSFLNLKFEICVKNFRKQTQTNSELSKIILYGIEPLQNHGFIYMLGTSDYLILFIKLSEQGLM